MPQNALALFELSNQVHRLQCGDVDLRNPRTLFPAQLVRLVHEHVRAHGDVLCVRTAICQAEHCIADLELRLAFFA